MDNEVHILAAIVLALMLIGAVFMVAKTAMDESDSGIDDFIDRGTPDENGEVSFTSGRLENEEYLPGFERGERLSLTAAV